MHIIIIIAGKYETLRAYLLICWPAGGLTCQSVSLWMCQSEFLFATLFVCLSEWPFSYLSGFFPPFVTLCLCHPHSSIENVSGTTKKENNLLEGKKKKTFIAKTVKCPHMLMFVFILEQEDFSILILMLVCEGFSLLFKWQMQNKTPSLFLSLYVSHCPLSLWLTLSVSLQLYLTLLLSLSPSPFSSPLPSFSFSIAFFFSSFFLSVSVPSFPPLLFFFFACL